MWFGTKIVVWFGWIVLLMASACGSGDLAPHGGMPSVPVATPGPLEPAGSPAPTASPSGGARAVGLDPGFGAGGLVVLPAELRARDAGWSTPALRLRPDGDLEVLVEVEGESDILRTAVLTIDSSGGVLSGPDFLLEDVVWSVVGYTADGGYMATGGVEAAYLVRLSADRTLDRSFGEGGFVEIPQGYRPGAIVERPGWGFFVELQRDSDPGSTLFALDARGGVDQRFNEGQLLPLFGPAEMGGVRLTYLLLGVAPDQDGGMITSVYHRIGGPLVQAVYFTYYDEYGRIRIPFGEEDDLAHEGKLRTLSGFGAPDQVGFLPDGGFLLLTNDGLALYGAEGGLQRKLKSRGCPQGLDAGGFVLAPNGDIVVVGVTALSGYDPKCSGESPAGFSPECNGNAIVVQRFLPDGRSAPDFGVEGAMVTDLGAPFGFRGTRAVAAVAGEDGSVTVLATLCSFAPERTEPGPYFQKDCSDALLRYLPTVGAPGS